LADASLRYRHPQRTDVDVVARGGGRFFLSMIVPIISPYITMEYFGRTHGLTEKVSATSKSLLSQPKSKMLHL